VGNGGESSTRFSYASILFADRSRAKLRASSYFPEWKEKFGPEAWSLLQKYSEPLG